MQAKEIMMFILAVSLAVGVVNAMGIFPSLAGGEAATSAQSIDKYAGTGIQDLDATQADDQSSLDSVLNFGLVGAAISTLISLIGIVAYPYGILTGWGVPALLALPIQLIVNAATAWSVLQFAANRSGSGID